MNSTRQVAWGILLTAALYFALGAAGLSMAVAPGYASPVFPAAGLAVAAMLWSQGRALAGIWLGSFCLNLGLAWVNSNLSSQTALVALGIAVGSGAQALTAWWLVRRVEANAWQQCESEKRVFRILVLAGPLACLVSASAGVSVLWFGGVIPAQAFFNAWWNWWSGDTLGVLVMLPLGLCFFLWRDPTWRRRRISVALPMAVALSLVTAAYLGASRWEQNQIRDSVENVGASITQALKDRFVAHQESLSALRRLIAVNPKLSSDDFRFFTEITLRDNPDIFALSVNPYVSRAQRRTFEAEYARRLGEPGFMIRERLDGKLQRAGDHPVYVPVGYIAPLEGNRPALGFNIYAEPVRRAAIERAITNRAPSITAPIRLVQEQRQRVGVLVMHPVFTGAERVQDSSAISALAVGVIKADEMIEIVLKSFDKRQVQVRVTDRQALPGTPDLFSSLSPGAATKSAYRYQQDLSVADRIWQLELVPTDQFFVGQTRWAGYAVGVFGLILATLLQVLLLGITGRTAVVERRVREQTAELDAKGQVLASRNAQLDAIFNLSPDGLVIFNDQDRLVFANPAFCRMLGWNLAELRGLDQASFEKRLKESCREPDRFVGLEEFEEPPAGSVPGLRRGHRIELAGPDRLVIAIKAQRAQSESLSRIVYCRDITYEAEVDRLKSEFLAHAAHELRTPLTSIHGFGELLIKMDLDAATQRELHETIYRHTEDLISIVNELLDLARIEQGGAQNLSLQRLDLLQMTQDACHDLDLNAGQWPLQLESTVGRREVMADRRRLRQVLINVLSNAKKYSPDGGAIEVTFPAQNGQFGVQIRDHGIGLTAAQLERIGERFWRADKSGKVSGSGLGIGIVKEILALHGGELHITSQFGQGSVFTIWLPQASDDGPPVEPQSP